MERREGMEEEIDMEDVATMFVMFLEGKMERILGFVPFDFNTSGSKLLTSPEIGEGPSPTKALCFKNGSVTLICGKSSSLSRNGYKPFDGSRFNTLYAMSITRAMASFHALLRAKGVRKVQQISNDAKNGFSFAGGMDKPLKEELGFERSENLSDSVSDADGISSWTSQISQSSLVSSNLSIMCSQFEYEGISSRVINKLESLQNDVVTLTQFLQFASAMQNEKSIQSVGPICMCDIWVPEDVGEEEEGDTIIIRLRGGPDVKAPPMRDITWIWLTLLNPDVLQNRYVELCESYCSAYNDALQRYDAQHLEEVTLFEIMRDLGDSFLHGFLTLVHKFTISGVWSLDRQLHTSEGVRSVADSIGFLVDNGIIGSIFVA